MSKDTSLGTIEVPIVMNDALYFTIHMATITTDDGKTDVGQVTYAGLNLVISHDDLEQRVVIALPDLIEQSLNKAIQHEKENPRDD